MAVVVVSAMATIANHRGGERNFLAQLDAALPQSAAMSADGIADWVALRDAQVRTLASLVTGTKGVTALSRSGVLPVIVREGGLLEGVIAPPDAQGRALRTRRLGDSLTVVDFAAPVTGDGASPGTIVLTAAVRASTFSHFNAAAADDRTQRTALLERMGDTVTLLTVSEPGGDPSRRLVAATSLPSGLSWDAIQRAAYTPALRRGEGGTVHGIGRGLTGREVVFAVAPVPGTPWLLVRERDVQELTALIRPSLLVSDAFFGVLTLLVIGVLLLRWRTTWLRREAESSRLRGTFVASVSHELRTPLTQIRMYAEMLRLGLLPTPDDSARALSVIEKEAERLTMLIERSLAFVRSGQPASAVRAEDVAVEEAVSRAVGAIGAFAVERGVTLRADIDAGLIVRIARDDLQQMLLNLLDNAIKYGPRGQRVDLHARRQGEMVRLAVRDEGPGVPLAERERIWAPFIRGLAATDTPMSGAAPGGSGIGLAVVRDLAARAGGRAYVEEQAGKEHRGASFVLELPIADAASRSPLVPSMPSEFPS